MERDVEMKPSVAGPVFLAVAPNGARKTKADHPMLPISPLELAAEARACQAEGASMIHLHVRDEEEKHSLDVKRYEDAIRAVRDDLGDDIVIQVTTEAVGIYSAEQQMDMVRKLKPEAVSLAIKELVPEGLEDTAASFFKDLDSFNIMPQFILYSAEDLARYNSLVEGGIIPFDTPYLLFVLGRYTQGQQSQPTDILPFLGELKSGIPWAVCAFGPYEHASASAALAMGGHVRVGFENNMLLKDGTRAGRNADLIRQARNVAEAIGRPIGTAEDMRRRFSRIANPLPA
jgi:3-keto-5-aminohexanoate cleavage enzyme